MRSNIASTFGEELLILFTGIFRAAHEIVGIPADEVIELLDISVDEIAKVFDSAAVLLEIDLFLKLFLYTMLLEYL